MLKSTNAVDQQQSFTIRVEQLPDGTFKASSKNAPKAGAVVARSSQVATSQMSKKLQDMVNKGEIS